jgi:hypothetical protein
MHNQGRPEASVHMREFQEQQESFLERPRSTSTFLSTDEDTNHPWRTLWYRLATYPLPTGRLANLQDREKSRRSRIASIMLVVQLFLIELPWIPVALAEPNGKLFIGALLICILSLFLAFFCNRRGNLTIAGLLMVASIEATIILKVVTVPGGINVFTLPMLDILVQPILIAVALLPAWSAFAVGGFNIIVIMVLMTFAPHAPDLVTVLNTRAYIGDVYARPIMLQVVTACFSALLVFSLHQATRRENQAEQVVALNLMLAESRAEADKRQAQFESGIQTISQAIQSVSDSHYETRVCLSPTHELWVVAEQLNQLFDRYRAASTSEAALEMTSQAVNELVLEIRRAQREKRPLKIPPRRNTPLDALLYALHTGR